MIKLLAIITIISIKFLYVNGQGKPVQCGTQNPLLPTLCPFLQGTACVASCTGGYIADMNQICQPPAAVPGASVSCGTANGTACVASCNGGYIADSNQICQPPTAVPGASVSCGTANGTACVASCTGGQIADMNQICQPPTAVPGAPVSCGTVNGQTADSNNICQTGSSSQLLALALSMLLLCLLF
ncbi:hypothetical protein ABPG74_019111 [Tetrahymena malaccensis]